MDKSGYDPGDRLVCFYKGTKGQEPTMALVLRDMIYCDV